jgi:hypothetical protein
MTLTREQIYTIIREFNCGDGYDAYERANQATDEIWDLVEPTVREDGKMLKSALYSPPDVAGVPASQPPLTLATFAPSGLPSRNEIASEVHAMLVHRFAYDEACLHGEFIGGPTDGDEYRMCEFVADLVTSLAYPEPAKPSREGVRKAIAAGIGAHAWAGSNLAGMECDCGWEGCEHDDHLAEAVADAVLALFAAQPTVREAKAEAWDAGWVSATVAMAEGTHANPYRSEANHG